MSEKKLYVVRVAVVGSFAGLALLLIALLGAGSSAVSSTAPEGSPIGALTEGAPEIGETAPDFRLQDVNGNSVQLSSLRGKPVLVNFWATWCGPCREEMPDINREYLERGGALEVLGVNEKEPDLVAKGFGYNLDLEFPLLLDLDGAVAVQYRVQGLPTTYFIDAEGIVRERHFGFMTAEVLAAKLATIAPEREAAAK